MEKSERATGSRNFLDVNNLQWLTSIVIYTLCLDNTSYTYHNHTHTHFILGRKQGGGTGNTKKGAPGGRGGRR